MDSLVRQRVPIILSNVAQTIISISTLTLCTVSHNIAQTLNYLIPIVPVNHSCDPNVEMDLSSANGEDWHVRAVKDIAMGDDITYFYPSTEWVSSQPFHCSCMSSVSCS